MGGRPELNAYNCATWAASVMSAAGVHIPHQVVPHRLMESARGLEGTSGPLGKYHEFVPPQQN